MAKYERNLSQEMPLQDVIRRAHWSQLFSPPCPPCAMTAAAATSPLLLSRAVNTSRGKKLPYLDEPPSLPQKSDPGCLYKISIENKAPQEAKH